MKKLLLICLAYIIFSFYIITLNEENESFPLILPSYVGYIHSVDEPALSSIRYSVQYRILCKSILTSTFACKEMIDWSVLLENMKNYYEKEGNIVRLDIINQNIEIANIRENRLNTLLYPAKVIVWCFKQL